MLAVAADWQELTPRPVCDVLAVAEFAHYIAGWPLPGDFGVVAEEDVPVAAAWWRYFSTSDPGYGFVDEETPEISIGVQAHARASGVGTLLLDALISAARDGSIQHLSLSVDGANPARRLYQRVGFRELAILGGSVTMVLTL